MKTRRSLRLENNIQTLLFAKSNNDNTIVPESPLSLNGTYQPPHNSVAVSVLETPEDVRDKYKRSEIRVCGTENSFCPNGTHQPLHNSLAVSVLETPEDALGKCKSKGKVSSTKNSFWQLELQEPAIINTTPNLKLSKRKDIEEILETDFLYCNSPDKNDKQYLSTPNRDKSCYKFVEGSGKRKSTEVVSSFELNGKELLTKKVSRISRKLDRKSKSSKIKDCNNLRAFSTSNYNNSQNEGNVLNDVSLVQQRCFSHSNISYPKTLNDSSNCFGENNVNINITTLSFEDNNLDLTPANCNNEILIQNHVTEFIELESDNAKENQSLNSLQNSLSNNISQMALENFHTPCNKSNETDHFTPDGENINFKKILEGEFSLLNKSLFQSQESLSPTQPASILILQGVVAFVDVRCGAENRSQAFQEVLKSLGAVVCDKFTNGVTHVIFREGSKVTIQKASQRGIYLVSPLWVEACRVKMVQVSEALFPISSEYQKASLEYGKGIFPRKLRSMQPREFKDDILIAEAKLKRRQKLPVEPPDRSNDVATPSIPLIKPSVDVNSPLFGIAHLLTPTRNLNFPFNNSNSSQYSAEDCQTPLATRMYNKLFSPLPNTSLKSSSESIIETSLSTEYNGEDQIKDLSNISKNEKLLSNSCDDAHIEENIEISQQQFLGSNIAPMSRTAGNSMTLLPPKLTIKQNKSAIKKLKSTPRRSKRLSNIEKNISCNDSINLQNLSEENPKSEYISSQSNSSNSSVTLRKRKLHTVEVVDPSDELIMPCTPPTAMQKRNADIYDTVKKVNISQRKELQTSLNCKNNKDFSLLPLPRNVQCRNKCKMSGNCNENLSPISESCKTVMSRRGRFSLCAQKRKSFEEFIPKSNSLRRNSRRNATYKDSLPCICLTSFHSSNIGSIYAIIKSLGGFETATEVNEYTTHVVCGSERRTINVLHGISRGCWLLDVSWLYESVELLRWAPEEPFELFNFCPGAKISRILRFSKPKVFESSLFEKFGRIYISDTCSPPSFIIQDLIVNCGAHVCSTIRSADLIISSEKMDTQLKQVIPKWLFDSIQYWEAKDLEEYLL